MKNSLGGDWDYIIWEIYEGEELKFWVLKTRNKVINLAVKNEKILYLAVQDLEKRGGIKVKNFENEEGYEIFSSGQEITGIVYYFLIFLAIVLFLYLV